MRSYQTTPSRGSSGGWRRRIAGLARGLLGERILLALLALYLALCLLDHSLPGRSLALLEPRIYASLLALLAASRALDLSGLPSRLSTAMLSRRPRGLGASSILLLVVGAGLASTVITNDAALFVYIPLVASLEKALGAPLDWLYVLVALSVNVTSMASPIGNPQNIYIWQHYHLGAARFALALAPYAGLALALLALYTLLFSRRLGPPQAPPPPPVRVEWRLAAASLSAITAVIALSHYGLQYVALVLTVALIAYADPRALEALDLGLVLVFALFFIDFGEASRLLAPHLRIPESPVGLAALAAGLSQLISNVPATVMLARLAPPGRWWALALGANLGGTLLLTGSLANLIVVKLSRLGVRAYHRYALPYSLALLAASLYLAHLGVR